MEGEKCILCYTWGDQKIPGIVKKLFKVFVVGFTLSQATKALRESRGIAVLYFRPLH